MSDAIGVVLLLSPLVLLLGWGIPIALTIVTSYLGFLLLRSNYRDRHEQR